MYTDWTAVILLLLTAVPLAAVVGTTVFFIWRSKRTGVRWAPLPQAIQTGSKAPIRQPKDPTPAAAWTG